MPIAETNALEKALRIVGPEAGYVARLTRDSTQHDDTSRNEGRRNGSVYSTYPYPSTKFAARNDRYAQSVTHAALDATAITADRLAGTSAAQYWPPMTQREHPRGAESFASWISEQ